MKKLILHAIIALFIFNCNSNPKAKIDSHNLTVLEKGDSLNNVLVDYQKKQDLPGFVVSIFNKDSILFAKGYGVADLKTKKPYTEKTVQGIASISKTFIATALMKVVEEGLVELDDNINKYLPYKITNINHPDTPITIRHLATHTSSFSDPSGGKGNIFSEKLKKENWRPIWHPIIKNYNTNIDMPMNVFLEDVFSNKENFMSERPGTYYEYSNYGSALLAHIIEIVAKIDFKTFTKKEIFEPLGMTSTRWEYIQADTINHITYYNDNYKPVPKYRIITYPDGGLYTNVTDLTKYMQEIMKGYYQEGSLLKTESFKEMLSSQSKLISTNTGIFWDLDQSCCIGHGGNDFGIATMMYFDIRDGIGRIVFTNIDVQQENQEEAFYGVFNETFIY
jgi:CubicO group peptidase (beta-lactamase class C family)